MRNMSIAWRRFLIFEDWIWRFWIHGFIISSLYDSGFSNLFIPSFRVKKI